MDIALFSPLSVAGTIVLVLGFTLSGVAAGWLMQRRRSRGEPGGSGWAVLVAIGGTFCVAVAVSELEGEWLEMNPEFSIEQLTGVWQHGKAVLRLASGGTYACVPAPACAPLGGGGRWERYGDFEVVFHGADGVARLERVVTFRGEFRLMETDDIDTSNRELTFRHRAPAS